MQSCGNSVVKSDLEKVGLKGDVKYMSEHYYAIKMDDNGHSFTKEPIESVTEEGTVDYIESFYNRKGMLEKYRTIWDIYMNTNTYIYEKGLLTEIKHAFNADRASKTTTFFYKGKKILEKQTTGENDCHKLSYVYDSKGNLVDDGIYKYKYDEKGNVLEKESDFYKRVSVYNDNNMEISYLLEEIDEENESYLENVVVEYDDECRVVKEIHSNGSELYVLTYTYMNIDEKGNWRIKKTAMNGVDVIETVRNIKYYDDKDEQEFPKGSPGYVFNKIIEDAYENSISYLEILNIPEVKERIVKKYSEKFYELAVYYADDETILHKGDYGSSYNLKCMNSSGKYASGTLFSYDGDLSVTLYLSGFSAEADGSLSIRPWNKKYYEDEFGQPNPKSPYFYITEEFDEYPGTKDNVEIRIDGDGVKFILRNGWTNFHYGATVKVKATDGTETLELPIKAYNGILYITWNDNEIYQLLKLWKEKSTIVSIIDTDVTDKKHRYTKEFGSMPRTELVEGTFLGW